MENTIKKRVSTPTVIQMEAVECGAAALSIVLAYHGRWVSLEELRLRCGVSRDGVNAYNLVEAGKYYGLESSGYHVDVAELKDIDVPAILYWNENHFVVLEGFGKKYVHINDPATGPRQITEDELKRSYSKVILLFTPGDTFEKGGTRPSLWSAITQRFASYKEALLFLFFVQLSLVVLGVLLPVSYQFFIDKIVGELHLHWEKDFLLFLSGVMLLTGFVTWLQGKFLYLLQVKLAIRFSTEFLWHVLKLPMTFFSQRYGGEIIYRMHLNTKVADFLTGELGVTLVNLTVVVIYGMIIFQYDALISLVGIGTACFNIMLLMTIVKVRTKAYARYQQEQAKTIGISLESLTHIETMKSSSNENLFFSRIAGFYTKNINELQKIGKNDALLSTLSSFSQQVSAILLLGIGCWRVMNGNLTVGMFLALQMLLANFVRPFGQLVGFSTQLQTLNIDFSRLDDVLRHAVDPLTERPKIAVSASPFRGQLDLTNVAFGYSPLDDPIIKEINFSLKPGQWIGLVGGVGSGKSTIAKLASGLYQPWEGQILYEGQEIMQYPRKSMQQMLAYVEQEIFLFSGTVRDYLTLWDTTIPDTTIVEAAKDACIHDDIMARAGGYFTLLTEDGRNFSQGQRQRLDIARALIHQPAILILDEATSALDSENETALMENLRKRQCSCLWIAHRLSTIRDCDEILILDQGSIVQRGTHAHLKTAPGMYKNLLEVEEKKYG